MPIYEYSCSKCNQVFEEWTQHHDAPDSMACPNCGGTAERIVSNTSFMLKGTGWYVTEYGTHKGKNEGGPGSAPSTNTTQNETIPPATPAATEDKAEQPKPAAPETKTDTSSPETATTQKTESVA